MKQTSDGFTLVEVLIVIIITGVIASIAAPGWLAFINRQRIRTVRDEMLQIVQSAQSDAQRTNRSYTVAIDSTTGHATLTVGPVGQPGTPYSLGSDSVKQKLKLDATVPTLTFEPSGQVSSSGANPPFVISARLDNHNNSGSSDPSRCVVVTTLLGGLATGEDQDCTSPNYVPVP